MTMSASTFVALIVGVVLVLGLRVLRDALHDWLEWKAQSTVQENVMRPEDMAAFVQNDLMQLGLEREAESPVPVQQQPVAHDFNVWDGNEADHGRWDE